MGKALGLLLLILFVGVQAASAENLPVTVDRYSEACTKTGGAFSKILDSGNSGIAYCTWGPARDRTECKVGSNQVMVCTIRCSSAACLNANPNKHMPTWPLSGGPTKRAPVDTLAPQELAPVN